MKFALCTNVDFAKAIGRNPFCFSELTNAEASDHRCSSK